ncbi:bifunctional HAD superfamily/Polynucleotide kinase 3 phosphatase [Babesia duncani]|uniref:Bifunctional HAD superfamily/Polynucleotide kinase 3 phosphatase n=1 Tax=Babesia duncani TaxID=323732 RepID=A0AAD9UPH5_9APIC|nr:bifunctional HAD superfamily/Polynucleotide kinase 3 phosphatase [Babesia duncani]
MMDFFQKQLNGGLTINRSESFYCGDAAGREWTREESINMAKHILERFKHLTLEKMPYMTRKRDNKITRCNAALVMSRLSVKGLASRFTRDFSNCDLLFAINNKLDFYTPEEYFIGLLILVGIYSSGKTTLCNTKLQWARRLSHVGLKCAK